MGIAKVEKRRKKNLHMTLTVSLGKKNVVET